MFRGMYISTTSMINNQRKMDTISNNLANVNTTGFKKDGVISESFPEMLLSKINDEVDHGRRPYQGIEVNRDGEVFNLEAKGGFFKVETPAGEGYGKSLKFIVDEQGYLKTYYKDKRDDLKTDGENYVLGKQGRIQIQNGDIDIDNNGNVISNGEIIDNLVTIPKANVIGTMGNGVRTDRVYTNFTQGNIMKTGNDLDFALNGDGFFKIQSNNGERYTRDGSFKINNQGLLVTGDGSRVLGENGPIYLEGNKFSVNKSGDIIVDGEIIDRLDIVTLQNEEDLRKEGDNKYRLLDGIAPEENQFQGEVMSGYLEGSNVSSIKEMVKMISTMRNYESGQRVVKSYDDILGKAVNEIGRQ